MLKDGEHAEAPPRTGLAASGLVMDVMAFTHASGARSVDARP
jgi:hypothetical protein